MVKLQAKRASKPASRKVKSAPKKAAKKAKPAMARAKPAARRASKVPPIPPGYATVTPYLIIRGAARALDFYERALGAKELMRFEMGGGLLGHAEMKIGDSIVMLADEHPQMGYKSPQAYGGTPVSLAVYVPDVDARVRQAVAAGARVERPVADQFYGDRSGTIVDPFGHVWTISTHVEDLTDAEIRKRAAAHKG
jgi:PhnB protein